MVSKYKTDANAEIDFETIFGTSSNNSYWKIEANYSEESSICPIMFSGCQVLNSKLNRKSTKNSVSAFTKNDAIKKMKQLNNGESIHSHRIPYILYVNDNAIPGTINDRNVLANILYNSSSTEGHFHVQYLVLLERFARYIRTSPNLLHKLVDQYERQIYGLLNISDIHKSRVHDLGKHQYAHSEKYDSTSFNPGNTHMWILMSCLSRHTVNG